VAKRFRNQGSSPVPRTNALPHEDKSRRGVSPDERRTRTVKPAFRLAFREIRPRPRRVNRAGSLGHVPRLGFATTRPFRMPAALISDRRPAVPLIDRRRRRTVRLDCGHQRTCVVAQLPSVLASSTTDSTSHGRWQIHFGGSAASHSGKSGSRALKKTGHDGSKNVETDVHRLFAQQADLVRASAIFFPKFPKRGRSGFR